VTPPSCRKRTSLSSLLLLGYILAAGNADATVWLAGTDDWFDPVNWGPAAVPTPADDTSIDNAGTAVADSGSPLYPPGVAAQTRDLAIGAAIGVLTQASGSLHLDGVDLEVSGNLTVGSFDGVLGQGVGSLLDVDQANPSTVRVAGDVTVGFFDGSSGLGDGTFDIGGDLTGAFGGIAGSLAVGETSGTGTALGSLNATGSVTGFDAVRIGSAGLGSSGDASGGLTVGGSLVSSGVGFATLSVGLSGENGAASGTASVGTGVSGYRGLGVGLAGTEGAGSALGALEVLAGGIHVVDGSALDVGTTNGDADATGNLEVTGDVGYYDFYEVGISRAIGGPGGNADGTFSVTGGILTGERMTVGRSDGTGTAEGTVALDTTLAVLDEGLFLGEGATLEFHVDGLLRGFEYAAMDAAVAELDGTANVFFDVGLLPGLYEFDLIVSTLGGILGDFSLGFNVFGLDPAFGFSAGVVVDQIGGNDVDVYRLTVFSDNVSIPAPSALVLVLTGLVSLGLRRRIRPSPPKVEG
jgi:hypothetical protein